MQVRSDEWHVRLYRWWYVKKYRPRSCEPMRTHTNLCPYVRAVLFWAPLRALFSNWVELFRVGRYKVTLNLLVIPLLMLAIPQPVGYISYYLKMVLWIATISTFIVVSVISFWSAVMNLDDYFERKKRERENTNEYREEVDRRNREKEKRHRNKKPSTFWPVVKAYLRSFHDRICPEVEIIDPANSKQGACLSALGLELKLQEANLQRPTLDELLEENRDDKGLDRRR